jgi:tetratricopeptide (TPR) repeat protein
MQSQKTKFTAHASDRINSRLSGGEDFVADIIDNNRTVNIASELMSNRVALLFYSYLDDEYFIAIQDIVNQAIITVLPSLYWLNLNQKVHKVQFLLNIDDLVLALKMINPKHYALAFLTKHSARPIPIDQKALNFWEKIHGSDHPETVELLAAVAKLYFDKERYEEAELSCKRALEILIKNYGPNDLKLAKILVFYGGLYNRQKRYSEADVIYKKAVRILETEYGTDDFNPENIVKASDRVVAIKTLKAYEINHEKLTVKRKIKLKGSYSLKAGENKSINLGAVDLSEYEFLTPQEMTNKFSRHIIFKLREKNINKRDLRFLFWTRGKKSDWVGINFDSVQELGNALHEIFTSVDEYTDINKLP